MFLHLKTLCRRIPLPASSRQASIWMAAAAALAGMDELTLRAAGGVVIGCVMAASLLVARTSGRKPLVVGSRSAEALGRARAVVEAHGETRSRRSFCARTRASRSAAVALLPTA